MSLPRSNTNITKPFYGGQEAYLSSPSGRTPINYVKLAFGNLVNTISIQTVKIKKIRFAQIYSALFTRQFSRNRTIAATQVDLSRQNKTVSKLSTALQVSSIYFQRNFVRARMIFSALIYSVSLQTVKGKSIRVTQTYSSLFQRNFTRARRVSALLVESVGNPKTVYKKLKVSLVQSPQTIRSYVHNRLVKAVEISRAFGIRSITRTRKSIATVVNTIRLTKQRARLRYVSATQMWYTAQPNGKVRQKTIFALSVGSVYLRKSITKKARASLINTVKVSKSITKSIQSTLVSTVRIFRQHEYQRFIQSTLVNVVKLKKVTQKTIRSLNIRGIKLGRRVTHRRSIATNVIQGAIFQRNFHRVKKIQATQAVSVTVIRPVHRNRKSIATVSYTIANSRKRTFARKVKATLVSAAKQQSRSAKFYFVSVITTLTKKQKITKKLSILVDILFSRKQNIKTHIPIVTRAIPSNQNIFVSDNWVTPQDLDSEVATGAVDSNPVAEDYVEDPVLGPEDYTESSTLGPEDYAETNNQLGEAIIPDPNYNN